MAGRGNPTLTGTETAFLDAAEQAEESERRAAEVRARAQARQIRRQRGLLAGAAVLLLATVAAGAAAVRQTGRADANAVAALDAETAAEARRAGARALATDDIDTSMLLAVAGVRLDDSAATRANLLAVLQQRPQLVRSVAYDGDPVTGLDVSPDGASVAVYDRRSGLRLYDTTTWETLAEVPRNDDRIPLQWTSPVAFSPDGALLAAGPAGVVRDPILLLAARTLEPAPVRLAGIPSGPLRVVDVGFSANGRALAATIQRLERLEEYGLLVPAHDRAPRVGAAMIRQGAAVDAGRAARGRLVPLEPGRAEPGRPDGVHEHAVVGVRRGERSPCSTSRTRRSAGSASARRPATSSS